MKKLHKTKLEASDHCTQWKKLNGTKLEAIPHSKISAMIPSILDLTSHSYFKMLNDP